MTPDAFKVAQGDTTMIYGYLFIMFLVSLYLVFKSEAEYKFELLVTSFFLAGGDYTLLLKLKLPGFDIQPDRALLLTFLFLLVRRILFPVEKKPDELPSTGTPWFLVMLYLFTLSVGVSLLTHVEILGLGEVIDTWQQPIILLLLIYGLSTIADRETFNTLGKIMIITGIISSIFSLIQIVDIDFMRYGEERGAFGSVLRSNGVFRTERMNAYFMISAMVWVFTTIKEKAKLRYLLMAVLAAGVVCTFHRMSWLVMLMVLMIYLLMIENFGFHRLILAGMLGVAVLLGFFIFAFDDFKESAFVQERLSDSVEGRQGYYTMVIEHIGEQPVFGFGGKNNEVYYEGMMEITRNRNRATGDAGGLHSGYFSTMFYYGIPSFVLFTAYVILGIVYFGRLTSVNMFFVIPFLMALLYAIGNLSNTILFSKVEIIYMMHAGLALGLRRKKDFFTPAVDEPTSELVTENIALE